MVSLDLLRRHVAGRQPTCPVARAEVARRTHVPPRWMRPAGRLLASTMLTATFGLANPDDVFEPLRIDAFADGAAAVVFFLPDQCPACELLAGWASKDYDLDVPLYFVSSAPVAELASWSSRHPNLAVVHDEQSAWGEALGVTEVPSVFILSDGNVINADYWPFFGGLEGL